MEHLPNALDRAGGKTGGSDTRSQANAITVAQISHLQRQQAGKPLASVDATFAGVFADLD